MSRLSSQHLNINGHGRPTIKGNHMKDPTRPGRTPKYGKTMIRRTYQITPEQDERIKTLSVKANVSESEILRKMIDSFKLGPHP